MVAGFIQIIRENRKFKVLRGLGKRNSASMREILRDSCIISWLNSKV